MKIIFLLIISLNSLLSLINAIYIDEQKANFTQYCELYYYPVQSHKITTEDGYVLQFFRIQRKYKSIFANNLPVIYLQHGFLDSSDSWIVNSNPDDNAPAFYFANRGYDVWVGNSRGNKYSRNHVEFNPDKDSKYWDFSWDEMAEFDLPSSFKYIYEYTKQKINYIGHSQGSCIMFAALSMKNQIILKYLNKFFALGPITTLSQTISRITVTLANKKIDKFLMRLGIREFFPENYISKNIYGFICYYLEFSCQTIIKILADAQPNRDQRLQIAMGHFPSGTSLKTFSHYFQEIRSGRWEKYNYDSPQLNQQKYGKETPPVYDLNQIKQLPIKIYILSGKEDKLSNPTDVKKLINDLRGMENLWWVEYSFLGHSTFLWGKNTQFYLDDIEKKLKT